jgi:hypothetical protein
LSGGHQWLDGCVDVAELRLEAECVRSRGRFVAGRSVRYGTIGIIDLNTGEMALGIEEGPAQVGSHMVFDEAGRLNLRMGDPAHRFDVVVCSLGGEWWQSTAPSADPIDFVLPNQK